jgi:hypothetical protein
MGAKLGLSSHIKEENITVLRRIFGPKSNEVTGGWGEYLDPKVMK